MLPLFAQAAGAGPPAPGGLEWEEVILFGAFGLFFLVFLGVMVYYNLGVANVLRAVHPANRKMEPGLVWLNLVPCVNYVWPILTVVWVDESVKNEYRDRGSWRPPDTGFGLGLGGAILILMGFPFGPFLLLFHLAKLRQCVRDWNDFYGDDEYDRPRRRYSDPDDRDDDEPDDRSRGYRRRYD
jgi:hypothetical protein